MPAFLAATVRQNNPPPEAGHSASPSAPLSRAGLKVAVIQEEAE